eukprot:TRINITY_DN10651_c0_g1_i4.p1 TRINITY_DN10651_c0_g1~~TRINITY_DN10651_c0_g1_i4.p1  ORF type:complete len:141 (-),score=34.59 TRINITY_DN10651_c0_g1_i4:11-376(-)
MKDMLVTLEKAHEGLRIGTLANWNEGAVPGAHLQTLLELVLAARRALDVDKAEFERKAKGVHNPSGDGEAPEYLLNSYKRYRDGQNTVRLIHIGDKKALHPEIGRAVQQECRDRSRMPSSA